MSDPTVEQPEINIRYTLSWWALGFFGTLFTGLIAVVLTALRNVQESGETEGILFIATVPFALLVGLVLTTRHARRVHKRKPSPTGAILARHWLTLLGSISLILSLFVLIFV